MSKIVHLAQSISDTPKELSLVALHMAQILIAAVRLTIHMGMQCHLGLMLLHVLETRMEEDVGKQEPDDSSYIGVLRAISMIPSTSLWDWIPSAHNLTRVCPKPRKTWWGSSGCCDHTETAHCLTETLHIHRRSRTVDLWRWHSVRRGPCKSHSSISSFLGHEIFAKLHQSTLFRKAQLQSIPAVACMWAGIPGGLQELAGPGGGGAKNLTPSKQK